MRSFSIDDSDAEAGNLTLKGSGDGCIGPVLKSFAIDGLYRTHELGLFERTVTYDNGCVKKFGICFEYEIESGSAVDCDFHRFVTDVLAYENGVRSDRKTVLAVKICRNALGCAFYHNCCAKYGLSAGVGHRAGHSQVLCKSGNGKQNCHCH